MKKALWGIVLSALLAAWVDAASLNLTEPNGGESLTLGTPFTITWTSAGVTVPLRLLLLRDGVVVGVIADSLPATATSYVWTVGSTTAGIVPAGVTYKVRVRLKGEALHDDSNGVFSIVAGPFGLTAPNGGESWPLDSPRDITWAVGEVSGHVRLDLYKGGTALADKVGTIATSTPVSTGKYAWTVGAIINGKAAQGSGYLVVISSQAAGKKDESDGSFTIAQARFKPTIVPSISLALTYPRRADVLYKGAGYVITWATMGLAESPVRLDLLNNAGTAVVVPIAKNIANDGEHFWEPPLSLPDAETFYKMRIQTMDGKHRDTVGPFTIRKARAPAQRAAKITVIAPGGPGQVGTGIVYSIRWKSTCSKAAEGPAHDGFDIHLMNAAGTKNVAMLLNGQTAAYEGINPDGSHSWHWDWHIPQNEKAGTYRVSVTSLSGHCTGIGAPFQLVSQQEFKEYVLKPVAYSNCYHVFVDRWSSPGHWTNPFSHYVNPKLGYGPNLARVGFAWIWGMLGDKQVVVLQAVFRSLVRFGGDHWYKEKGHPLTAVLTVRRKHGMLESYGPSHFPVLGGGVLLDKPVNCPLGDANLYAPLASIGSAVPAVPDRGNSWRIDLSQSYRMLALGSRPDHGVLLYSSVDSVPACSGACRFFNVEFYEVSLTIRFAKDIE